VVVTDPTSGKSLAEYLVGGAGAQAWQRVSSGELEPRCGGNIYFLDFRPRFGSNSISESCKLRLDNATTRVVSDPMFGLRLLQVVIE